MGGMRTFLALMLEPLSHPKGEEENIDTTVCESIRRWCESASDGLA